MDYNGFAEMMSYYHWDFFVYYILVSIIFTNCIKSFIYFTYAKRNKHSKINSNYTDVFISILSGIGLLCGTIFQGILTDIPVNNGGIWLNRIIVLDIIGFVLFIIQFNYMVKGRIIEKRNS